MRTIIKSYFCRVCHKIAVIIQRFYTFNYDFSYKCFNLCNFYRFHLNLQIYYIDKDFKMPTSYLNN